MDKFNYLSIDIKDTISYINILGKLIEELYSYYEEIEIQELLLFINEKETKSSIYKFPSNFHITTYFKKTKIIDTNNKAIKEFEKNKQTLLGIKGLVVIPKKIVVAFVNTDEYVNNKIPHITSCIGTFKPKDSNEVLESIDSEIYSKPGFYKENIKLWGNKEECYILVLEKEIEIEGFMTSHF